jgi:hypothetical protein
VWWLIPVISAIQEAKAEDLEFKTSMVKRAQNPVSNTKEKQKSYVWGFSSPSTWKAWVQFPILKMKDMENVGLVIILGLLYIDIDI